MPESPCRIYQPDTSTQSELPLAMSPVSAGFPSPAEEFMEERLDLNEYLIRHPASTFFVRVAGDSMIGAGIHDGDLLIVDRSATPALNSVVIAVVDGELTVKRYGTVDGRTILVADNSMYPPIEIHDGTAFEVWGVATFVVHPL